MTFVERAQKFHTDDVSLRRSGWCFWLDGVNRPFPSSKKSHFQNEAKCETFVVKMSFISMTIKNHFHINGFALNLALKVRLFGTRKWPIFNYFYLSQILYVCPHIPSCLTPILGVGKSRFCACLLKTAVAFTSPYVRFSKDFPCPRSSSLELCKTNAIDHKAS